MTLQQTASLPLVAQQELREHLRRWEHDLVVSRIWNGDASVWSGGDEASWLGWLQLPEQAERLVGEASRVAPRVLGGRYDDVVLLGMGGSSLGPDVLRSSLGSAPGAPRLRLLDSTDPDQLLATVGAVDPRRTLFVVSSKSGTTIESRLLMEYFFDGRRRDVGSAGAGASFIAVTDPGSPLEAVARERGFRDVFLGEPTVGGRYSVLSPFGLVPAAAIGIDIAALMGSAREMRRRCDPSTPIHENPGVMLGLTLGVLAVQGRDKVSLVLPRSIASLGGWIEQLLAESTGKTGRGVIPIDGESVTRPDQYGSDRVFVHVCAASAPDADLDAAMGDLARAGHPVVRLPLDAETSGLGGEFFRWEFATAVVGAVLGVNPFDQPDVESSKVETRRLVQAYGAAGGLPVEKPRMADESGLEVHADDANAAALKLDSQPDIESVIAAHCSRLKPGDYFSILAYVEMCEAHRDLLQRARHAVRDGMGVATSVGFGPRFLHSTGQAHKGGPNLGVFLYVTHTPHEDVEIPGERCSLGAVEAAQASGDLAVLSARGRRVLRIHITGEVREGLIRIVDAVERALTRRPE